MNSNERVAELFLNEETFVMLNELAVHVLRQRAHTVQEDL